jgi:transcriptional regulator with XRE-family HTH domain
MKITYGNLFIFTFVILKLLFMRERLLEFLKTENKSSAQFADEIGVQASGISHILSGRNNPSLDFVLKMLEKYRYLSSEWLLFGKGPMYKEVKMQTLFENNCFTASNEKEKISDKEIDNIEFENRPDQKEENIFDKTSPVNTFTGSIKKIVWFYDNNSFEEFCKR